MKIRILSLLAAVAALSSVHATSVSLSNAPFGRSAVDFGGIALDDGSLVLVGTFSNISELKKLPAADLASAGGWAQFGNALAIGSVFGNPGKLVGTTTDLGVEADAFDGKTIYLWIFNGATVEASTQYGIFTAAGGVPEWTFPENNGGIGDLITISADDEALTAVAGLGSVDASRIRLTEITAVPEPATSGVFGISAAFLCLQRALRRRKSD